MVNPFDLYAMEMALQLKENRGGKIYVISMGPEQAGQAVRSCLEMGADEGRLISGGHLADQILMRPVIYCHRESGCWRSRII